MQAQERLLRYALMKLSRQLDSRFESLLLTGRVSKWYSAIGHEASTVAAGLALKPGDVLCTLHRDLGAILGVYLDPNRTFPGFGFEALSRPADGLRPPAADGLRPPAADGLRPPAADGLRPPAADGLRPSEADGLRPSEADGVSPRPEPQQLLRRLACQLLGRGQSFTDGIERSFHYSYLAPEVGIRHVGMISHLGTMIPVAAGLAFALRQSGTDGVALNFIGDGGTSTGDFHEGLNIAAVWKLPLVLIIENNRYAFSTPNRLQYAAKRLSDRGPGYGIVAETVDGNDPDEVSTALERAVARARSGQGPALLEVLLGRMRGHAEGDGSYEVVPEEERQAYLAADPVTTYARRLERDGVVDPATRQRLEDRVHELAEDAVDAALKAPQPEARTALRPVFAPHAPNPGPRPPADPGPQPEQSSPQPSEAPTDPGRTRPTDPGRTRPTDPGRLQPTVTYIEAIHQAMGEEMERDPRVILMGQDIGAFEGAFRATRGFHRRWPDRVRDTPIAESGTLGLAAGAAIGGYRPIVEMQFADFVSSGFNQLVNLIAKLYYRNELPCPLVVRLPSGGGVAGGPFHSQNPEAWFAHTAGLKVVCPATVADAAGLLVAAVRDPNPVLFFEHKYLYRRIKGPLPQGGSEAEIGRAQVRRRGGDLSLISYGASTWTCLEAAEELAREGVEAEVVDLRTLIPYDEETVLESVTKTGRALVVHEAPLTLGFGAEVAARLADRAFPWLDAPIRRVAHADRPIPYAKVLEQELLPTQDKVLEAARDLMGY